MSFADPRPLTKTCAVCGRASYACRIVQVVRGLLIHATESDARGEPTCPRCYRSLRELLESPAEETA